ncbi:MAG: zinc-ribbon domain-containing protein [Acidaminococcaceae bacterium]|nr:zinc-ribbon domain-containing protein [Acidaminococcaceae bacterium]
MGFFSTCGICGKSLMFKDKQKVADGIICKECADGISWYFRNWKTASVAEIQRHLEYREANRNAVAAFHPTRSISMWRGGISKLFLDDNSQKFTVSSDDFAQSNPDIFDFSQIEKCEIKVERRIRDKTEFGYDEDHSISYTFFVVIFITGNPWFTKLMLPIGSTESGRYDKHYLSKWETNASDEIRKIGNRAKRTIDGIISARQKPADEKPKAADNVGVTQENALKESQGTTAGGIMNTPKFCANCGSKLKSGSKFCENCGAKLYPE